MQNRDPKLQPKETSSTTKALRFLQPTLDNTKAAIQQSETIQTILIKSAATNFVYYAMPEIIYEGLIHPVFIQGSEYEAEVDIFKNIIFFGVMSFVLVSNMLYYKSLIKAAQEYIPNDPEIKPCRCNEIDKASANVSDVIYQLANVVTGQLPFVIYKGISLVKPAPSGLKYAGYALSSLAYGNALVGLKYTNKGQCADHARDVVNDNKLLCFTAGFSLYAMTWLATEAIKHLTQVESFFVEDAIFSYLYQFHILMALLNTENLTHNKSLVDFFSLSRHVVSKRMGFYVEKFFKDLHTGKRKINFVIKVNRVLSSSFMDYFIHSSAAQIYIDLHKEDLRATVKGIIRLKNILKFIPLPTFLTPSTVTLITKIVTQSGWSETKKLLDSIIRKVMDEKFLNEEFEIIEMPEEEKQVEPERVDAIPEDVTALPQVIHLNGLIDIDAELAQSVSTSEASDSVATLVRSESEAISLDKYIFKEDFYSAAGAAAEEDWEAVSTDETRVTRKRM